MTRQLTRRMIHTPVTDLMAFVLFYKNIFIATQNEYTYNIQGTRVYFQKVFFFHYNVVK